MIGILAAIALASQPVAITNLDEQCTAQPNFIMCTRTPSHCAITQCVTVGIKDVAFNTDKQVRAYWRPLDGDSWYWRAPTNTGKVWFGNCVALTEITMESMAKNGIPTNRMWRALVNKPFTKTVGHMVSIVEDENNDYWVVGDALKRPYLLKGVPMTIATVSRMDRGNIWYDVLPGMTAEDALAK